MPSLRSTSSGCGSTSNSYPALSRLFVEHIDPCCNDCNLTLGDDNLVVDTKFDRVGINTSNPVEALDVDGNIIASGNVSATTMDVSNGTTPGLVALNVTGDVDVTGDMDVNGTSTITGSLEVVGTSTVSGDLSLGSQLLTTNTNYSTSTSNTIGYANHVVLAADLNISNLNNTVQRLTPAVTLNPGVWLCEGAVALTAGVSGSVVVNRIQYGFNSSSTSSLPSPTSTSWKIFNEANTNATMAVGQADTWPIIQVCQVVRLTSQATNVSLFANTQFTSGAASIGYRGSVCYARFTRLA